MKTMNCGEALVRLLRAYGIDGAFGIPGVHTVEFYRGFSASGLAHVTPRHEQGAAFMAYGHAAATGRPAACLLITGPGVLNAATAIAEAYANSLPMLVVASVNRSDTLGMGSGQLHEMTSQQQALSKITAFTHTLLEPSRGGYSARSLAADHPPGARSGRGRRRGGGTPQGAPRRPAAGRRRG
jgi:acetolactate synthase-1/2/3 large subunit